MALATLEMTPLPQDIDGKSAEELVFLYRKVKGMRAPQLPKAQLLIEAATNSIGLTEGHRWPDMKLPRSCVSIAY
ncbi:Uncharacterised protein [Chlamydia trachomatis]|nr:Uncharacterised protein [Chlamydia trachomatis]